MRLEELFNSHIHKLNETDFTILNYIVSNKNQVVNMSLEEISEKTYVSAASLVRCAKKLGFSGFSEFKYFIKRELVEKEKDIEISANILKDDIQNTLKLVSQTNLYPICKAIEKANKIIVFGTDWGEKIAAEILVRSFLACNIYMHKVPSVTEMNWCLENLNSEDLVIIISFRGKSSTVKNIIGQLKMYDIPFISITPLSKSPLASEANFNLYYKFTNLQVDENYDKEYNLYSSLLVLIEMLFSYYYDNFFKRDNENEQESYTP